ncbi:MAG: hypothetical protein HYR85_04675 [Planctomycetes bacterium]|nr:hypothetical protein [Planctomycetota bacterium]MBI3843559.1 hypothetical protein [Planctomycetota bacterium]
MTRRTSLLANPLFLVYFAVALAVLVLAGCNGGGGGGGLHISAFSVDDNAITEAHSAMLNAKFSGGTGVIDNGVGPVTSQTPVTVTPAATTTYTLTVTGVDGRTLTRSLTISVYAAAQVLNFRATPSVIAPGSGSALVPLFVNGVATIDHGIGAVASGTSIPVMPAATTSYLLTVTNPAGDSVTSTASIRVTDLVNLPWAKSAGGIDIDKSHSIAAFPDGSTIVTGQYKGEAHFGVGEPNQTTLLSGRFDDIFVARMDVDGTLAWVAHAGGTDVDEGLAVATCTDGTCVATGFFQSRSITFGIGEPNHTRYATLGMGDVFVTKYRSDGSLLWAKRAGGTQDDHGQGISCFADGGCVVTGYFSGTATFGIGEPNQTTLTAMGVAPDAFVLRLAADGKLLWAKQVAGSDLSRGWAIATVVDGSTVVTGEFREDATFGSGEPNQTTLLASTGGRSDVFVARYNADGTLAWAKSAGGQGIESGRGIATFTDGSCVVSGGFGGFGSDATFGAGEANETTLVTEGLSDAFLARYNADGTLAWATQAGGVSDDSCFGVSSLSDGSCVVTGFFSNVAVFGHGESTETTLMAPLRSTDIFIARYAADGMLTWARHAGGNGPDEGHGVAVVGDAFFVLTGVYEQQATFGPTEPNEYTLNAEGQSDIATARYTIDGEL